MEEARRFIRYVIPGLATILQLLVAFLLLWPEETKAALRGFKDPVTVIGGGLLASGGLGYLLSIIFYWLCWPAGFTPIRGWLSEVLALDHRIAFASLPSDKSLDLAMPKQGVSRPWSAGDVAGSITESWVVASLLWLRPVKGSYHGAETRRRVAILTDVMNGHGTTLVGPVIALIGVVIAYRGSDFQADMPVRFGWVSGLWGAFLIVQLSNYLYLKRQAEMLIATVLLTELRRATPVEKR